MPSYASSTQAPSTGCIPTRHSLTAKGYGHQQAVLYGEVIWGAHRVAWALANGRPPAPGKMICHRCDWRACVNPDHLYEGTASDNARDRFERNPMTACRNGHAYTSTSYVLRKGRSDGSTAAYRRCVICLRPKPVVAPSTAAA